MLKVNNFLNIKKGGEKIFSIWWFFIIAVVGLGIVIGVWIFYAADVDVRQVEAEMLYERIANCIIDNGFVDAVIESDFDVFEECHLSKDAFNGSSFYFRFNISDVNGHGLKNVKSPGANMEVSCEIVIGNPKEEKRPEVKGFPRCVKKQEMALYYYGPDRETRKAVVEILTASNNIGEQISL